MTLPLESHTSISTFDMGTLPGDCYQTIYLDTSDEKEIMRRGKGEIGHRGESENEGERY